MKHTNGSSQFYFSTGNHRIIIELIISINERERTRIFLDFIELRLTEKKECQTQSGSSNAKLVTSMKIYKGVKSCEKVGENEGYTISDNEQ